MTDPDRRLERYRFWPLEAAIFVVVIGTFAGTLLMLPQVREVFRARGWSSVPVAFVAAPAFQVVVLLLLLLMARWVVRTPRPFTRSWGEMQILHEARAGAVRRGSDGADTMDEAAIAIEVRARRAVIRFLTFLGLLLTLQLAFVQYVVLSLASARDPSRPATLIVAVFSIVLVVFVAVRLVRGLRWRRR